VDFIRVIAIFLVIVIHVCARLINKWGKIPDDWWLINLSYDAVSRLAVPLFFMVSSYLLLSKSESIRDFFRKRAVKVLIPFIAWSLIYTFWYCNNEPDACRLNPIVRLLLTDGIYYHLWFLYALIGFYLVTPVLRLLTASNQKHVLWYLVGLWLVFEPLLSFAKEFWNFKIGISVPMAMGFMPYFILGYLLGELKLSRFWLILSTILWAVSTFITAAGTIFLTTQTGQYQDTFFGYLSMNVILASATGFILLIWLSKFTSPRISALVKLISPTCFGIYLIHIIVLEVLSGWIPRIRINASMGNPLWSVPLTAVVIFILSFVAVYLLRKIPFVKWIVP